MSPSEQDALLEALTRERRRFRERIASALHDDICQSITAAGLSIDLLKMDLPPAEGERLLEVQSILENAFERVRLLSYETHPEPVRRFGFAAAMARLLDSARTRFKGTIHARIEPDPGWDLDRATAVHDILEAALDNVVRHAKAAEMSLTVVGGKAELRDNGVGFDSDSPTSGLGFTLMNFWARRAALTLKVTSTAGSGTIISLR